ncbi:MAG TPA: TRAM domain-containing protein, partial [Cytophagaceae bacterium]
MRHKKKSKDINTVLENITVLEMAAEGKCVSRHENKVIFTEYTAPGDVVDLKIVRDKKNFAMGVPITFHSYSKDRTEPFCQHFGTCGGCKWQHINYDKQIGYKATQVKDALDRIAKVQYPSINPILGSNKTTFYRNKLEFTFSNKKWLTTDELQSEEEFQKDALGFHIAGRFDKILDIQKCYLQSEISNEIRNLVREFAKLNSISFFDIRAQKGLLRNLIIRNSDGTGQLMVIVQFFEDDEKGIVKIMEMLRTTFPQITSLLYVINSKGNETFHDLDLICYAGKEYILEEMEGLQFRIGPKSFYQTNSTQAYELYKIVRRMSQLKGDELVYDLYTGT